MTRKYPTIKFGRHEFFRDTVLQLTDPSGVLQTIPVGDGDIAAIGEAARDYAEAHGLAGPVTPQACINPEHGAAVTCADCAKACEAELIETRDRYMRLLGERSQWEREMKAVYQRRYQSDLNTFGAFHAAGAMGRILTHLTRVAYRASNFSPDMALAKYRGQAAELQRAGAEALAHADSAQGIEADAATRMWQEWRAENKRLRELLTVTGQAIHKQQPAQARPCRCAGCELIRGMDTIPVTAENDGLPTAKGAPGTVNTEGAA